MPSADDRDDLVGRGEIASRAGVAVATVDAWRRRHPGFPAPVATVGGVPVWRWRDVAEWVAVPRRAGRPRGA